ncbi:MULTISPECIES: type III pantothenate kinase [unclassified Candidatus Frackibacter]|uniref:type III pantothenate kinase n=1 Tax=unclassified Candidatus Frackibacter TaxID=2648818 RepID=UPI00088BB111|nr:MULTISPECIES: type III pantothenate kinase [unclassified Candidatus Frackibacter]SDC84724.1 type III pantothenate kinase [Candidatus Frackibacter sp. WG11]SEM99158.1 type III pantothenate kinase [Candidatus Frackibacter sp. WG12]SFM07112.1 type III pantothenate kinase [Candidatus Frackibacter sp. WG13]
MILAIDVGNTNTVLGVFDEEELVVDWRIATEREKTADEYGMLFFDLFNYNNIEADSISRIIISCVVPPVVNALEEVAIKYFGVKPLIVGPGIKTGIDIKMDNPKEVGADRIVNAIAAYRLYGGPAIVVDFGTATTFCLISKNGDYLGGAIAPGINISMDALFNYADKLPKVELNKPASVIGKNTIDSLKSGIIHGAIGQVDGVIRMIKEEINQSAEVIATGGLAELVSEESKEIDHIDSLLTLEGLRMIAEFNS